MYKCDVIYVPGRLAGHKCINHPPLSSLYICINKSLVFWYNRSSSNASAAVFTETEKDSNDAPLIPRAFFMGSNPTDTFTREECLKGWADLKTRIKAPTAASCRLPEFVYSKDTSSLPP